MLDSWVCLELRLKSNEQQVYLQNRGQRRGFWLPVNSGEENVLGGQTPQFMAQQKWYMSRKTAYLRLILRLFFPFFIQEVSLRELQSVPSV